MVTVYNTTEHEIHVKIPGVIGSSVVVASGMAVVMSLLPSTKYAVKHNHVYLGTFKTDANSNVYKFKNDDEEMFITVKPMLAPTVHTGVFVTKRHHKKLVPTPLLIN